MIARRAFLSVVATEPVGPYTMLRVRRGDIDPGVPGQFFMLGGSTVLPRPMSLCAAPSGELAFLIDPIGAGTRELCALELGSQLAVTGPLGRGYHLDAERPILVGGGIGVAPLPYLAKALPAAPIVLGFRTRFHAEAASLLPGAEVVIDPVLVTEPLARRLAERGGTPLACGPEPMLAAVGALSPAAQLALEAPMGCGHGGCYGCVVDVDGARKRLCVEGPVIEAGRFLASEPGTLPRAAEPTECAA